jgi:[protein-PII] uridylyltransferase
LSFARAVGTPEVLRKLLVLTAADIAAVGPGFLTKWKESLLTQLYLRTLSALSGEQDVTVGPECLKELTSEVAREIANVVHVRLDWIESQLSRFPLHYLHGTPPQRIAAHLRAIRRLRVGDVLVEETFNEDPGTCEYTVITYDNLTPGIFSKIVGVMTAQELQILDAQIITRDDGAVVGAFKVSTTDHAYVPPGACWASVAATIVRVLKGEEKLDQLMSQDTRLLSVRLLPTIRQVTEVEIDNETSDRSTIIDVFADETQGLLYAITRSIFQLGLSVHAARVSLRQELNQVAGVFYVTDEDGTKIKDHARLEAIRSTIKQDIDLFMGKPVNASESVSAGSPS